MKYFEALRHEWIANRKAPLRRQHLVDKFGISMPQASRDINRFIRENPNTWAYNVNKKQYERV